MQLNVWLKSVRIVNGNNANEAVLNFYAVHGRDAVSIVETPIEDRVRSWARKFPFTPHDGEDLCISYTRTPLPHMVL